MSKLFQKLKKERERLDKAAESRGNFEKIPWWKPQKGDNMIRVLPDLKNPDEELPFRQISTHFIAIEKDDGSSVNIGVRCLRELDDECPVCETYEKFVKVDKDKAGALRPRTAYLYNIVDYKAQTVHPWSAGVTAHEQIMGFAEDFTENIFSLDSGRDWKVIKKVDPKKSAKFGTTYAVRPGIKDSALPEKLKPLLETAIDLNTLYTQNEKDKMIEWLQSDGDYSEYLEVSAAPAKKGAKVEEEEEAVDIEKEFEEEAPKVSAAAKAKAAAAKVKSKAKEEDGPSESDFGDFEEEPPKKTAAKPVAGKTKVAAKPKEEEEDLGIGTDDDELEDELRDLGVM